MYVALPCQDDGDCGEDDRVDECDDQGMRAVDLDTVRACLVGKGERGLSNG